MAEATFDQQFAPAQDTTAPAHHAAWFRDTAAGRLGLAPADLGDDADPIMLGFDSITTMALVGACRRRGVRVTFAELAERRTFGEWTALVAERAGPGSAAPPRVRHVEVDESEPFDLALMQHAYWVGRADEQELGGVSTHFYNEFDGRGVDPGRLEGAVRALLDRHAMLRVSFLDDGRQRILPASPWPGLTVHDLRDLRDEAVTARLEEIRDALSHRMLRIADGEVFDVRLSLLPGGRTRVHVNLDMLAADAVSFRTLTADLAALYEDPGRSLPPLSYGYPSYLADRRARDADPDGESAAERARARDWWRARLPELPGPPELPAGDLAREAGTAEGRPRPRVTRRHHWLGPDAKARLTDRARAHGITTAMALAAVFAETLGAWSAEPRFLLNLPLFDREELHPDVPLLVGDFSSSLLLAADVSAPATFTERASALQDELRRAIAHAAYPGIEVLRDLSRLSGGERVLAPVVYTSALNLGELFADGVRRCFGDPAWIISQGPQVRLDAQVTELDGGILVNWDVRDEAFPPGVIDAMFGAFRDLVDLLATDEAAWTRPVPDPLPAGQRAVRDAANDTAAPQRRTLLHEGLFDGAAAHPGRPALLWDGGEMTYGDLAGRALSIAAALHAAGLRPGGTAAVTLPKGPDQAVAVLGVLAAGGVYVPVGVEQPGARRAAVHASGGIGWVLTDDAARIPDDLPGSPRVLELAACLAVPPAPAPADVSPDDPAYVLFTSGSTGVPKGVEITHRGAANTIEDLNDRFGVGPDDRVLAVSSLTFDLSVYDVFGLLAAGGAVVVPGEDDRRDAERWLGLMDRHRVTVWNTVPVLFDMLLTAAEAPGAPRGAVRRLALVMLGGDWVGLDLPGRLRALAPDCRCTVLGGATEASIQSVLYEVGEVDPRWRSIPYGRPLRNQRVRVADAQGRDRPDLVPGELWIGGAGVHGRYRGDDALTADRFVEHGGERWYRTGDRVRRLPDGNLEILGRTDFQVKIAGNRIEPGEVEAAVRAHPAVRGAVAAVVADEGGTPRLRAMAAIGDAPATGDLAEEIRAGCARSLPPAMLPELVLPVAELPLTPGGKVDRRAVRAALAAPPALRAGDRHDRFDAPRGPIEEAVASLWADLLGTGPVARGDDFFRLGGDSLSATRSVSRLRERVLPDGARIGGVELGALLRTRTVAAFAATLRPETGDGAAPAPALVADPANRGEPFPLTDVQHAYLLGRDASLPLGGIGANFYLELDGAGLDVARFTRAWDRLIARHEMLRAVVADGRQRILRVPEVPGLTVRTWAAADADAARRLLRPLRDRTFDPACWPLFAAEVVRYGTGRVRVGINLDPIVFDGLSVKTLMAELARIYADPDAALPEIGPSFRDYVLSVRPGAAERTAAEAYWYGRLDELPPGPMLPLAADPATLGPPRFTRHARTLPADAWARIKDRAREHGLTPSSVLLTCFAEVLSRWSAEPDLTLNLTLFDRRDVHPDIERVVGDFSSLILLAYRPGPGTWLDLARETQEQLARDIEHRAVSAVEVQRRLARRVGVGAAVAPVVFTSTLGAGGGLFDGAGGDFPAFVGGGSQTPQVWLDHQVVEQHGDLLLSWDVVEKLFPDGLIGDMFAAYLALLDLLADPATADAWKRPVPDLRPSGQVEVRERVNATAGPVPEGLLHGGFFRCAARAPGRVALLWGGSGSMTYGELSARALEVAGALRGRGVRPGDTVAVCLPKGSDQVVAVLGVLSAGAAYLPVGVDQPPARRDRILAGGDARWALTEDSSEWPPGVEPISVGETRNAPALQAPVEVSADMTAYVVFTSGSTGEPKGVEMTHRAALNTVEDISARYGVGSEDRVLAVSALDFDLSVYDVFGLLGAGGALVLVEEEARRDPERWHELVALHQVTVWNTVPVLFEMFLTAAAWQPAEPFDTLRLVLVSGDWVARDLGARLSALAPGCLLVALGGATEAAIWSNQYEVTDLMPDWPSVPYGTPLRSQCFRVVDAHGRDCPDWVPGELWIGGAGVARGYRNDPVRTAERFPLHDGRRWYRTGDLGRYRPGGLLEFLGRTDHQVKIRGHRIELGEIEAALRSHPGVRTAVAVVAGSATARLGAVLVPNAAGAVLDPEQVRAHAAALLPAVMLPEQLIVVPELPTSANGKVDRAALARRLEHAVPDGAGGTAPRGPVEEVVAETWAEVLGRERPDRTADFFLLGGDSLAATRVVGHLLSPRVGVRGASVGALFERPVLADFAAGLRLDGPSAGAEPLSADPAARHEPFPLTEVQHAYLLGRADGMPLGGIGTTYYLEFTGERIDTRRLSDAWNALIARHEMLRVVVEDGAQRVLPHSAVTACEVRTAEAADAGSASELLRRSLTGRTFDPSRWPLYASMVVHHGAGSSLGIVVDYLVLDGLSVHILLGELAALYDDPDAALPPLEVSFRDYVLGVRPSDAERTDSERYWRARLGTLPPAPRLPLAKDPATVTRPRFSRREGRLAPARWAAVKTWARDHGVTPSMVLLACYAEVLSRWSAEPDLTINLTLFDRRDVHPGIGAVLGDFTSLTLLEHRPAAGEDLRAGARRLQERLAADLDHRAVSAVWVQRELARAKSPAEAAMPVVFTSTLGMSDDLFDRMPASFPAFTGGASQTPQVWLDHQVMEQRGALVFHWDAVDELFPDGLLDDMFAAYQDLVATLITAPSGVPGTAIALPAGQVEVRERVSATAGPVPEGLLHGGFFRCAARGPERVALLWGESGSMTYGELSARALGVAGVLRGFGVRPGDTVAVCLPKGPDQVVAVLGVLAAGAAYLPVGVDQPPARRDRILATAEVRHVVADDFADPPDHVTVVRLTEGHGPLEAPAPVDPDSLAYVVFTSGSTGEPKGVEMTHRAALNTVEDISARYGVGSEDRVLAVSALDFDLSVYDVFGLLGSGGALVLVEEEARRDPERWHELVALHQVTVWNTVPVLFEMFLTAAAWQPAAPGGLRLVLVSGDWVAVDLHERLRALAPDCRLIALGGATEAAIWSNHHEISDGLPEGWPSVPYGTPLRNQCFRVVDAHGRDCPDWVPGELWIGGAGVARGYRNDPVRTAERFPLHDGRRWYRTGDLGRYRPGGLLEFLGRTDHQVKVRGHRIELGEIEAALRTHKAVGQAVVTAPGERGARRLVAFVRAADGADLPEPAELRDHLAGRLPAHSVPAAIVPVDAWPVTANGKIDRAALHRTAGETAPGSARPRGATEELVAALWSEVLGVAGVGRDDGFFALGGDSLLGTRLLGRLHEHGIDAELADLFGRPVLRDFCAGLTRSGGVGPAAPPKVVPDPAREHEPFEATDVQRAYWVGRRPGLALGGVGAHYYSEFDGEDVDVPRLERAWNLLIARHAELRSVFTPDGRQRFLPAGSVPPLVVRTHRVADNASDAQVQAVLDGLREWMSHQVMDPERWPLFDVRAVRYRRGGRVRTRVAVGLDNIVLDGLSMMIVFSELEELYRDPAAELPPRALTFRDYRTQVRPDPGAERAAREYWLDRLDDLPPGPLLPLRADPSAIERPRFVRREVRVPARVWGAAKDRARAHDLTPAALLLACYAEVLSRWSAHPDLTVNLTLFDRRDVHPDIGAILGDFTSLLLLEYRTRPGDTRLARAHRLRDRLARDLGHREVSAVWVLRELARRGGTPPGTAAGGAPVVFTSGLGIAGGRSIDPPPWFPARIWGVSQTPQVWLDQQVSEAASGDLVVNWDCVADLFDAGTVDAMFGAYRELIELAATDAWAGSEPGPSAGVTARAAIPAVPPEDRHVPEAAAERDAPPDGETERVLAEIWRDLLGVRDIGRFHDFFVLGGDSLLATRMLAAVHRRLDTDLTLREFFAGPTIAEAAALCAPLAPAETEEGEL
ncbi:amino acid adenylation domain-containing protein [Actinomadura madurae]|uniref:amino acid adenylation domain-containing protein n=1 Tax=Actinomadura madurae TaxID=1993 RepID=UPI00399BF760